MSSAFESGPIGPYVPTSLDRIAQAQVVSQGGTCEGYRIVIDGQTFFKKQLRPAFAPIDSYRMAFKKEFEIGRQMNCPILPRYYSLHDEADSIYILMSYIEGETLTEKLEHSPEFFASKEVLTRFLNQLTEGVTYLHRHQIVHADLQPNNIMLTRVDNSVRIIDLGYCYHDAFQDTQGHTNGFSAPEEKMDARSDIYSIGKIILYLNEHSARPFPKAFIKIANRCITPDPAQRFQSVEQLQQAIKDVNRNRHSWTLLAAAATLILGVGLGILTLKRDNPQDFTAHSKADSSEFRFTVLDEKNRQVALTRGEENGVSYHGSISVPDSVEHGGRWYAVTALSDSCFVGCDNIHIITLPPTLRIVGEGAAYNCKDLTILNLPDSITAIGKAAFWHCTKLQRLRLPLHLTSLGDAAFSVCESLTEVVIPEGVTQLPQDVFARCSKLSEITLPSHLQVMRRGAFWRCTSLQCITIPSTVQQMDELLFVGCTSLHDVYMQGATPPRAESCFDRNAPVIIHVPQEAVEAYQSAPYWKTLHIVGE